MLFMTCQDDEMHVYHSYNKGNTNVSLQRVKIVNTNLCRREHLEKVGVESSFILSAL
jgi:hypothetical protein